MADKSETHRRNNEFWLESTQFTNINQTPPPPIATSNQTVYNENDYMHHVSKEQSQSIIPGTEIVEKSTPHKLSVSKKRYFGNRLNRKQYIVAVCLLSLIIFIAFALTVTYGVILLFTIFLHFKDYPSHIRTENRLGHSFLWKI